MTDKKYHHKILCYMCLIVCLTVSLGTKVEAAQAPESRILRVAFSELEGMSETNEYGSRKGLLIDYLNEISKYTGWSYEFIEAGNEDVVNNFIEGQYDLMGGTFYSPDFEQYFAYPDYSTGRSRAVLLCRRDDDSIRGYDLTSLDGKTIGVYENAVDKIRHLNEFLTSNDLDCELKYYTHEDMEGNGNLYKYLRNGDVDMLLGNDFEISGEFRMVTYFQAQPYYIVTNVGNTEVLDGLNMALQHILESAPNFAEDKYNANFPDAKMIDIQLNDRELQYINKKKTITIAVTANWHPFCCFNNPSELHEGMLPELVAKISEFTGLKFNFVYSDSYAQSIRMVQQGEADIAGAYLGMEEQAFDDGLALSQSYISISNIVLKHKSVSYPDTGQTCGIMAGQILPESFLADNIISYDTVKEMVEAVNIKEVDYIYGASSMLEREIQNHRYMNVVPVTLESDNTDVTFAIARPVTTELLTILNKAIGSIPAEDRSDMLNRNLVSLGYASMSVQDIIYANPVAFILISGGFLLLVMAVILLVIRNKMKNSLMQSQLEAAEARSMAKSEFLSQMSHEIRTPMNAIIGLTNLTFMERDIPPETEKKLRKIHISCQYLLSLINDILDMSRIENGKMELEQKNFSLTVVLDELQGMMSVQAEQNGLEFKSQCRINHGWLVGDPVRLRQILTNLLSNAIKFTPKGGTVTLIADEVSCDDNRAEYFFSVEDTGIGILPDDQDRIFVAFEQLMPSASRSTGTGLGLPISRSIARLMGGDLKVMSQPGTGSKFNVSLRFLLGTEMEPVQQKSDDKYGLFNGVQVLLAEDNDLNAEIAQELLAAYGIVVCRAANGQEAVDMFVDSKPGEFRLILMDIRMPVMDGHEAARQIRSSQRPDSNVPIVAMTANSFKEDEDTAHAAGMDGFVSKPVDPEHLLSVMLELL